MEIQKPSHLLPVIIFSQFAGTSLWFAGNAILPEIQKTFHLDENAVSSITASVQFGFIAGTFVFALLAIADRFRPSAVYFICSLLAAGSNLLVIFTESESNLLLLRFLTGFFLAGIYPVGMKIAADWYDKGLGRALGYLVGALVLGTSFPHILKAGNIDLPWKQLMITISIFAFVGGLAVFAFIPSGPFRQRGSTFKPSAIIKVFKPAPFRAAAFGYFGHMWELYTFWAFIPAMIQLHNFYSRSSLNIPLISFISIAAGAIGCITGGLLSTKYGSARIAFYALATSFICCLLAPSFIGSQDVFFIAFLFIWGIAVAGDSPQFSALVAGNAGQQKGTALTIVTCIGFAITIVSIFLFERLWIVTGPRPGLFIVLAPGPLLGLISLLPFFRKEGQKQKMNLK